MQRVAQSSPTYQHWWIPARRWTARNWASIAERNWTQGIGNIHGLMHLVKEMKRKFKALDRKRQVNGEYLTIRGFTSFDKWFTKTTGKTPQRRLTLPP